MEGMWECDDRGRPAIKGFDKRSEDLLTIRAALARKAKTEPELYSRFTNETDVAIEEFNSFLAHCKKLLVEVAVTPEDSPHDEEMKKMNDTLKELGR